MTEFDRVNALVASTPDNGVAFAVDNGRVALMCHIQPGRAREVGELLIKASDAAMARRRKWAYSQARSP